MKLVYIKEGDASIVQFGVGGEVTFFFWQWHLPGRNLLVFLLRVYELYLTAVGINQKRGGEKKCIGKVISKFRHDWHKGFEREPYFLGEQPWGRMLHFLRFSSNHSSWLLPNPSTVCYVDCREAHLAIGNGFQSPMFNQYIYPNLDSSTYMR